MKSVILRLHHSFSWNSVTLENDGWEKVYMNVFYNTTKFLLKSSLNMLFSQLLPKNIWT